jgi:hypothetical protein
VSVSRYQQEAEVKDIRAEFPAYAAIHRHILQDALARLEKPYQAFFRRVNAGEKAGFPRSQGPDRSHSFTYKEFGNGATRENGFLVLSQIGRIAVRWSRPMAGMPRPSPSARRQTAGICASPAPMCQRNPPSAMRIPPKRRLATWRPKRGRPVVARKDYLRVCCRWGGLPGLERARDVPAREIGIFTRDLLPL